MSKKLYRDLINTSAIYFILRVIGIFRGILFPRILGPEQWGLFSITTGIISLLGPFAQLAMSTTLTTYISKYKDNKQKLKSHVNSAYFVAILSSFLVSISLIFLSDYLASSIFEDNRLKAFLLLGSGILFFNQVNTINRDYFRGFKDFKKYNILKIIPTISYTLLAFSFLILFSYRSIYLLIAQILIFSILGVTVLIYLYRYEDVFNIFKIPQINVTKKVLKFGVPLIFTITFMTIMKSLDRILIGYFLDISEVGIYSVAAGIPLKFGVILSPISTVLLPTFSERYEKKRSSKILLKEIFSFILFLSIPLIIFIILFSEDILFLFFGSEYILGSSVLAIASFEIFFYSGRKIFTSPMLAAEKTGRLALLFGISAAVNIILNVLLIPILGMEGAALGTVLSFAILFFLMLYLIKKEYEFDIGNINIKAVITYIITLITIGYFLKVVVDGIVYLIISGVIYLVISTIFINISSPIWYKELIKYIKSYLNKIL